MSKKLTPVNEITLHYKRPHIGTLPKLMYPSDAIKRLREVINENTLDFKEYFWVLSLTLDNRLLGISELNSGGIHSIEVSIREIIQVALMTNAVKIILVHNHPSGNLNPSVEDVKITHEISKIGERLQVYLEDHLIITSECFSSIKARANL